MKYFSIKWLLLSLIFFLTILLSFALPTNADRREICYAKTEEMAIMIAFDKLYEIYNDQVYKELPLTAELAKGFWIVSGTLHQPIEKNKIRLGGVGYVIIKQIGCEIIYVMHGE